MNNKKYLLCSILILFINVYVFSQNFNLKFYSDYRNDFRGVAAAIYLDNLDISELNINNEELDSLMLSFFNEALPSDVRGRTVDKLTRNNFWLFQQALSEWDLVEGEMYLVTCAESIYSDEAIIAIVLIENGGNSFKWWARTISE